FRINGGTEEHHPLERTGYNLVADNHLHHFGLVYPSAVGVLLMNTNGNTVAHNEIGYGYYTAVSLGWRWGYQRSVSRDNVVEYNHIHHIGQGLLSDMGGIYTLGVSPGTVIRNNLVHDIDANRYGGWGIYNDEGSTHVLIENNIVHSTKFAGYDIHFAREITVRNNIFALGRLDQLSRTRMEPHKSVFFETNIVYWTTGELLHGNWEDRPYSFYFHPKDASGTRTVESTFDMDWNLYFNPNVREDSVRFGKESFAQWRGRGKDVHSLYTDPLFVDPARYDFRLRPGSPAFRLGFRPIDMSSVGPRN
ncbi:MAG: right-handed parallel beta-helix repeat-containing protein, partial [Gemmatimonadetes bacterium]|nr:right-handed parallel beta-helix repeat-containing protein [Gemmatimonadota bacterium]